MPRINLGAIKYLQTIDKLHKTINFLFNFLHIFDNLLEVLYIISILIYIYICFIRCKYIVDDNALLKYTIDCSAFKQYSNHILVLHLNILLNLHL